MRILSRERLRCREYVVGHEDRGGDATDHLRSVDEFESMSGLDFFIGQGGRAGGASNVGGARAVELGPATRRAQADTVPPVRMRILFVSLIGLHAALRRAWRRCRHVLWVMNLHPDLEVELRRSAPRA